LFEDVNDVNVAHVFYGSFGVVCKDLCSKVGHLGLDYSKDGR